jgi:teichuronic acid biosynthesis glycosyltransferase TuaH
MLQKNILYFMHIPWGWVKQRPHFLAEGLAVSHNVILAYIKPYFVRNLIQDKCPLVHYVLNKIPLPDLWFVKYINIFLVALQVYFICKINKIDTIWITDVRLYCYLKYIRFQKNNITLIYDCMDDTLAFPKIAKNKNKVTYLLNEEQELLKNCDIIFSSSETLLNSCNNKANFSVNQIRKVVNNALDEAGQKIIPLADDHILPFLYTKYHQQGYTILIYLGTIASWLDIQSIKKSLSLFSKIVYFFVGPAEIDLSFDQRVIHIKPVPHSHVKYIMSKADILVMPFIVNKLIEAVDPVKMYEYVSCNKPIIASAYYETLKFSNYANLYSSTDNYCALIEQILSFNNYPPPNSIEELTDFRSKNSWQQRVDSINETLQQQNQEEW